MHLEKMHLFREKLASDAETKVAARNIFGDNWREDAVQAALVRNLDTSIMDVALEMQSKTFMFN